MIHPTIFLASSLLLAPETPTDDTPRDPDAEAPVEESADAPAEDSAETDAETPPDSSDTTDASEAPAGQPQVADPAELPESPASTSPRPSTPANRPRRAELPPDREEALRSDRRGSPRSSSSAAGPLAPSTHGAYFAAAVGTSFAIHQSEFDTPGVRSFQIEEEFGYHLSGEGSGFAIAIVAQQSRGFRGSGYVVGARILGDLLLDDRYSLALSPSLTLGYRHATTTGVTSQPCVDDFMTVICPVESQNQVTVQLGLGLKLSVLDRLILSLRPITLEFVAPRLDDVPKLGLRWQILGGLGLNFG